MQLPGVRPSVCLSVRPSRHSPTAATCGAFAAERRTDGKFQSTSAGGGRRVLNSSDAAALAAARRSAANASSVTFTADVGSWTQICLSTDRPTYRVSALAYSMSVWKVLR